MTQFLLSNADNSILAWGTGLVNDADSVVVDVGELTQNQLVALRQAGNKVYQRGQIQVTPPAAPSAPLDYSALRGKVQTLAQSAVGVTLDNLTAAQRLALVACLLFNAGALDPATLAVKPLAQWIHQPPNGIN